MTDVYKNSENIFNTYFLSYHERKEVMSCSGSLVAGMWGCNNYGDTPDDILKKNACTMACCKCTDPPKGSAPETLPPDTPLCVVCGTNNGCKQAGDLQARNKCLTENCGTECVDTFPDQSTTEAFVHYSPFSWGWPVFSTPLRRK